MWFPKALQFFSAAAQCPWGRFALSFLKSKGLSVSQIAILRSAGLVTKLFTYTLWGMMADMFGDVKIVYVMSVLVGAFLLEPFRQGFAFYSLGTILLFKVLRSASNSIWPLTDAITVKLLRSEVKEETKDDEDYGKQRLWCSFSWGAVSLLTGIVIDKYGVQTIFEMYYFWSLILAVTVLWGLPSFPREEKVEDGIMNRFRTLGQFTSQPQIKSFFKCILLYAMVMYMVEIIPIMQLEEFVERGIGTRSLIGAAIFSSTATDIVIFYYGGYLVKQFSPQTLLAIAHYCCIARFFGYILVALFECPMLILPFQLLNGGSFAIFWLTTMDYTHSKCPSDLRGSVQGCLGTLVTVAQATSCFFWGQVYELVGPPKTYLLGIVILCMSLFLLSHTFSSKRAPMYKALSQIELIQDSLDYRTNKFYKDEQSSDETLEDQSRMSVNTETLISS